MQKNYKIATTLLMKIYSYDKLSNTKSLTLVYTDEVSMCHYDKGASPALAVLRNMVYTVEIQIISTTNIRNSWENKTKKQEVYTDEKWNASSPLGQIYPEARRFHLCIISVWLVWVATHFPYLPLHLRGLKSSLFQWSSLL